MINKILQIQERNTLRAYNDFLKKIKEQYDQLYDLDKKIVDMISEMEQHKEQILVKTSYFLLNFFPKKFFNRFFQKFEADEKNASNEDEECVFYYYIRKNKVELKEKMDIYKNVKLHRDQLEAKVRAEAGLKIF